MICDPFTGLWRPQRRGLCSIMPGLGYLPPGFGAKALAGVQVTDLGTQIDTGTNASSFSFGSFGAEAADRVLIAGISAVDAATSFEVSGDLTIGGVTAEQQARGGETIVALAMIGSAPVPTGTSGTVDQSWSEAITQDQGCVLLRVTGLASHESIDSSGNEVGSGTVFDATLNAVGAAGDLAVAIVSKTVSGEGGTFSDDLGDGVPWTEVEDVALTDSGSRIAMAYKLLGVAPSGSWTISYTSGPTSATGILTAALYAAA